MRSRLDQAVAAVSGRCGGDRSAIRRVDVDRQGALSLTVVEGRRARWFVADDLGCHELLPEQESAVPLAADIPRLQRTGAVEVLAWRPGRRLVLRLHRGGASLLVKGHRPRRSHEAARRHQLAARVFAGGHLNVPALLSHDAERACLTVKHASGGPLGLGSSRQERFFRIGVALRAAQQQPVGEELPLHGSQEELAVLDDLAERVEAVAGSLPVGWSRAREHLDEVRDGLNGVPPALAHRDLHDGQFLDDAGRLTLLDFDLLCRADPLLDAANLLVHLKLRSLQELHGATAESVQQCGRTLLDGLDREDEPAYRSRLRFYQAATLLRLALIYRLRPAWQSVVGPLILLSERCFDELVRG
jgi:hypothetical protein